MATLADLARFGWGNRGGLRPSGAMGQQGFRPSPRPMGVPVSGAQPWPTNSTTGGVGTTMQANAMQTGGLQPNMANGSGPSTDNPAPTNGPRLPPIPPGTDPFIAQNWGFLHSTLPQSSLPTSPDWFNSPQGLAQQGAMAQRVARGAMGGLPLPSFGGGGIGGGQHPGRRDPRVDNGEGYVSPYAASKEAQSAQSQANWANPDWRMQQVLAGKIAPTNAAELQAMLANMSPADRQAYIDRYRSIGLDVTYQPTGGGSGPFGN